MQWRMFDLLSCLGEEEEVLLLLSFPTPYKPNKQRKWVYYWLQVIFIDLNDNNLPLILSSSIVQQLRTVISFKSINELNIKVMRMKEGIANSKSSWLIDEFSLEVTWKMYREQYGELAYWCLGVHGWVEVWIRIIDSVHCLLYQSLAFQATDRGRKVFWNLVVIGWAHHMPSQLLFLTQTFLQCPLHSLFGDLVEANLFTILTV